MICINALLVIASINQVEFESAGGSLTTQLIAPFARKGALVRSAAGRLQVMRVSRANGDPDVRVFVDEDKALAFVLGR